MEWVGESEKYFDLRLQVYRLRRGELDVPKLPKISRLGGPGDEADMTTTGLLLAAGAGRRMGRPKALVEDWLVRAVGVLRDGGCAQVVVVLGAAADEARLLLEGQDVEVVVAGDWDEGMGASLRAGLAALRGAEDAGARDAGGPAGRRSPTWCDVCWTVRSPRRRSRGRRTTGRRAIRCCSDAITGLA